MAVEAHGEVDRLEWDSEHFGFPVARVSRPESPERLRRAAERADRMGVRCLMALIAADRVAAVEAAEAVGFRCYDIRIELDRVVSAGSTDAPRVRLASEGDLPGLESLARTRFTASRFYADPGFPDERAGELYVAWLRRGLETEDRLVLTNADRDGFVVCQLDREAKVGTVELIAVAREAERSGSGANLVAGAEATFGGAGLERARVVTQGRNLPAQRLYQAHGYRSRGVALWLHRWRVSR